MCCDTESCQKILKSLHELGDGSCNCLSYCLTAAASPHCRWPLWLLLHPSIHPPFLQQPLHQPAVWVSRLPSPCACRQGDSHTASPLLGRETPTRRFWENSYFSWPVPKLILPWSARTPPRNLGQEDGAGARHRTRVPRHTHQNAAFLFLVCLCELALSEVEQQRQLRALPVLHLLPKTSSK